MNALALFSLLPAPMRKKKIEFSSHTGNLALMRSCVRNFLDGYPFSEKERLLMVLGVDEACTNIIRYAYELKDDQLIALCLEDSGDCLRMRLRDFGKQVRAEELKGRAQDIIRRHRRTLHGPPHPRGARREQQAFQHEQDSHTDEEVGERYGPHRTAASRLS